MNLGPGTRSWGDSEWGYFVSFFFRKPPPRTPPNQPPCTGLAAPGTAGAAAARASVSLRCAGRIRVWTRFIYPATNSASASPVHVETSCESPDWGTALGPWYVPITPLHHMHDLHSSNVQCAQPPAIIQIGDRIFCTAASAAFIRTSSRNRATASPSCAVVEVAVPRSTATSAGRGSERV